MKKPSLVGCKFTPPTPAVWHFAHKKGQRESFPRDDLAHQRIAIGGERVLGLMRAYSPLALDGRPMGIRPMTTALQR